MCGIVGVIGSTVVADRLLSGLKKLEYRGYDSAGIAVVDDQNTIKRLRVMGKVAELEKAFTLDPLDGRVGIAHTRWATHGVPAQHNAHPFLSQDQFALVHNGIIENHQLLRQKLIAEGFNFQSETDSEVIVHLLSYHYTHQNDLLKALRKTMQELQGAYALGILARDYPDRLFAVRQGSPLVIGQGKGENFLASDPLALLSLTQQFIYLEDADLAEISQNDITIYDKDQVSTKRKSQHLSLTTDHIDRGPYRHFMQKEIMEQGKALKACLSGRITLDHVPTAIFGPRAEHLFAQVTEVQLVACGTSYHAGCVAQYWLEALTDLSCRVEIASEFRYRKVAKPKQSLMVTLSQSGETADTLAALRRAQQLGYLGTLTICNVAGSSLTRESDIAFLTHAGVEIGVASTKAFITQLISLMLLALAIRKEPTSKELIKAISELPELVELTLKLNNKLQTWAEYFRDKAHAIFLGRGLLYPIALEGALKMKEISYIHAEGYPSGELKHGPLALVDPQMPVIACAPKDDLWEKSLSNLQEVNARGGKLFVLTDAVNAFAEHHLENVQLLAMPTVHPLLQPILYTVPLQLLAYHVAVLKGTDVDQPRNLAKSVTVE